MLSWCAKFGVPRETRHILGYHSIKGVKTMLHYSRDEQAGPLHELLKMLKAVENDVFFPDASRSGRFAVSKPASAPEYSSDEGPE
eukprot:4360492-Amphidinium_carterae.1